MAAEAAHQEGAAALVPSAAVLPVHPGEADPVEEAVPAEVAALIEAAHPIILGPGYLIITIMGRLMAGIITEPMELISWPQ